jgi:hypothetical protein
MVEMEKEMYNRILQKESENVSWCKICTIPCR